MDAYAIIFSFILFSDVHFILRMPHRVANQQTKEQEKRNQTDAGEINVTYFIYHIARIERSSHFYIGPFSHSHLTTFLHCVSLVFHFYLEFSALIGERIDLPRILRIESGRGPCAIGSNPLMAQFRQNGTVIQFPSFQTQLGPIVVGRFDEGSYKYDNQHGWGHIFHHIFIGHRQLHVCIVVNHGPSLVHSHYPAEQNSLYHAKHKERNGATPEVKLVKHPLIEEEHDRQTHQRQHHTEQNGRTHTRHAVILIQEFNGRGTNGEDGSDTSEKQQAKKGKTGNDGPYGSPLGKEVGQHFEAQSHTTRLRHAYHILYAIIANCNRYNDGTTQHHLCKLVGETGCDGVEHHIVLAAQKRGVTLQGTHTQRAGEEHLTSRRQPHLWIGKRVKLRIPQEIESDQSVKFGAIHSSFQRESPDGQNNSQNKQHRHHPF